MTRWRTWRPVDKPPVRYTWGALCSPTEERNLLLGMSDVTSNHPPDAIRLSRRRSEGNLAPYTQIGFGLAILLPSVKAGKA